MVPVKVLTRSVGVMEWKSPGPPARRGFLPSHARGHWLECVWMASSSAREKCPRLKWDITVSTAVGHGASDVDVENWYESTRERSGRTRPPFFD